MSFTYEYERAANSADAAVFRKNGRQLEILLILRKNPPYQGMWALPGGFMEIDESLEETAVRELEEETGLKIPGLKQYKTFSQVNRDPRTRVITTVFYGMADFHQSFAEGGDDAEEARWFPVRDLPALGFDHKDIISGILSLLISDDQ